MKRFFAFLTIPLAIPLALGAHSVLRQESEEHESELHQHMHALEDALKVLRRSVREGGEPGVALAALVTIQEHTLHCKGLVPETAQKVPEAERAAFVTAYRKTMVDFLTKQLELEAALLDGDPAAIQAALERVRAMEDSSHERFAPEEH